MAKRRRKSSGFNPYAKEPTSRGTAEPKRAPGKGMSGQQLVQWHELLMAISRRIMDQGQQGVRAIPGRQSQYYVPGCRANLIKWEILSGTEIDYNKLYEMMRHFEKLAEPYEKFE